MSGISFSVSQNLITVPLIWSRLTSGDGTPSMPPSWPIATWIPTPVRKPTSTVREMKSARKPSRATRARMSRPPVINAARLAKASHSSEPGLQAGDAEAGDSRVHDRGRGGVAADDEMARRAEDGEGDRGQQDRVEARDHRRACDLRVPHHLGDRECRERDTRHDVLRQQRLVEGPNSLQHCDVPAEAGTAPGHRRGSRPTHRDAPSWFFCALAARFAFLFASLLRRWSSFVSVVFDFASAYDWVTSCLPPLQPKTRQTRTIATI